MEHKLSVSCWYISSLLVFGYEVKSRLPVKEGSGARASGKGSPPVRARINEILMSVLGCGSFKLRARIHVVIWDNSLPFLFKVYKVESVIYLHLRIKLCDSIDVYVLSM